MSSIDRRQIIEDTLPRIAKELMQMCLKGIGEGQDYRTTTQSSYNSQADYSRPFHRVVNESADGYEYVYMPMRKPDAPNYRFSGRNPSIANECQVKFRNLRVTDIVKREYGSIDKSPAGSPQVSTISYPNDSPEPLELAFSSGTTEWTEWGSNWQVAMESEIEQTITAGSEVYGIESETKVRISASAETGGEQSGGSEKTEEAASSTTVQPYHVLDVTISRQPILASQKVLLVGTLDFEIDVVLEHMWGERCANWNALLDVFRGLGAHNDRIRDWFSDPSHCIPESVLESITRPTARIDIGLSGVPADDITQTTRQRPV